MLRNFVVILVFWLVGNCTAADFDHSIWDNLFGTNIVVLEGGKATQVNYDSMLADRGDLHSYLDELSEISREKFEAWSVASQLAFLINAYNAWTIEIVLSEYPDIDSIRNIGFFFNSAWRRNVIPLFGSQVSLDDIEHGMIRGWGRYREPRIHFAVNCAAVGCPALRAQAYQGDQLERQLDDNTRLFLSDKLRNYVADGTLFVSRIFDWYEEDFEQRWGGIDSVAEFLAGFENELVVSKGIETSTTRRSRIRYVRYNWSLNRTLPP